MPAHDPHQISFAAAFCDPAVRWGVAELVRVQVLDAGGESSASEHEADPVCLDRAFAFLGEPEPSEIGPLILRSGPKVSADGERGRLTEG